jgi:hypothetical protein
MTATRAPKAANETREHRDSALGSPEVAAPAPSGVRQAPAGLAPRRWSHHSRGASVQSAPDHPAAPPLAPSQAAAARWSGTAAPAPVWMDLPVPRPDDHPRMHRVPVAARAQRWKLEGPPPEHLHPLRPTPPNPPLNVPPPMPTESGTGRHLRPLHPQSPCRTRAAPAMPRHGPLSGPPVPLRPRSPTAATGATASDRSSALPRTPRPTPTRGPVFLGGAGSGSAPSQGAAPL